MELVWTIPAKIQLVLCLSEDTSLSLWHITRVYYNHGQKALEKRNMLTVIKTLQSGWLMTWWEHLQNHGYWPTGHWFSSEITHSPKFQMRYWRNNFLFFHCHFFLPPWSCRSGVILYPKAFYASRGSSLWPGLGIVILGATRKKSDQEFSAEQSHPGRRVSLDKMPTQHEGLSETSSFCWNFWWKQKKSKCYWSI